MSYTAKELLPDWYSNGLKRDVPDTEITSRRKVIDAILGSTENNFWLNLIKIYFGVFENSDPIYVSFVGLFKDKDENFPLENRNIVQILAGCVIAQKIEDGTTWQSDIVALAFMTFKWEQQTDVYLKEEILLIAHKYWIGECIRLRESVHELNFNQKEIKIKTGVIKFAAATGDTNLDMQNHMTVASGSIINTVADLKAIAELNESLRITVEKLISNNKIIAEESDILWWILSEYSFTQEKSFKVLSFPAICIIAPIELANQTLILPGLGRISSLVNKIFSLAAGSEEIPETINFSELITSLPNKEKLKSLLELYPNDLEDMCPIFFSLTTFNQYSEIDWLTIIKNKISLLGDKKIKPLSFVEELYKEIMLIKIYNIN